ncbi:MutS protein msh4 [Blyttiomyces sp. JEL0837]|nr:MutS protein msh4 [Blyttiomyces sp. JEL0837]
MYEGVGGEIGIAQFDMKTAECIMTQYADNQTYTKTLHRLYLLNPAKILLSSTAVAPTKSRLVERIEAHFDSSIIIPIDRRLYNDTKGLMYMRDFSTEQNEHLFPGLSTKYFANSCIAAVLEYFETTQDVRLTKKSIRFNYVSLEGLLTIDPTTARNLELVSNITTSKAHASLFDVMNKTVTPMGGVVQHALTNFHRRDDIELPAGFCRRIVEKRGNDAVGCVFGIVNARSKRTFQDTLANLRAAMKSSVDIDQVITALVYQPKKHTVKVAENYLNAVIALKHMLKWLRPIRELLRELSSDVLQVVLKNVENPGLRIIEELIDERINEDITYQKNAIGMRNQRCYAVKAGWNGLLDVARQTYRETTNDVYELVQGLANKYDMNIKVTYNNTVGYLLTMSKYELIGCEIPQEFLNVSIHKKNVTFTTLQLMSCNDRIQESICEVLVYFSRRSLNPTDVFSSYLMSDKIVADLIADICEHVSVLYKTSESIALLDMLSSFAFSARVSNYVRPDFTDTYAVKHGRHPIREKIHNDAFIPNDIYCSDGSNLQIITGPNMSGKSTYLKMIALIDIMAQMGSFVPAEYASIRVQTHIFSRIGCDSLSESNSSSFTAEMAESAFILKNMTGNSLVIIDELGRGSSYTDGIAMCMAICEELARSKSFTFVATHFAEAGPTLSKHSNVVMLHLDVDFNQTQDKCNMKFLYQVKDGPSRSENYGLIIASLAGFPISAIERAAEVTQMLKETINAKKKVSKDEIDRDKEASVADALVQAMRSSKLSESELRRYLADLRETLP